MRIFVAIAANQLSFDSKSTLKKIRVNLDKKEIDARWVPETNFHVSLNFIGEMGSEQLLPLKTELQTVASKHSSFSLEVSQMGVFPSDRAGRVIWLGIQNSIALRALQADTCQAISKLGLPVDERQYVPHLTVARLRSPRNLKDLISPLKNHNFGIIEVKEVTLYESKLTWIISCV